jgi:hypothetical protein
MSRLATSILKREQVLERVASYPLTLALGSVLVFAQAVVMAGEVAGLPFGSWLALNLRDFHPGGLLFALSHYAPVAGGELAAAFRPLDFIASVALFVICGLSLLTCGPAAEAYYGTRKLLAALVLCLAGHALLAAALPAGFAYSPMAFCTFLIVTSLLVQLQRRETRVESRNDMRMGLLLAALVLAAVSAGFLPHPSYAGLPAALAVGPALAVLGFVLHWKLQMRGVRVNGQGRVGNLYFVEEIDLLTHDEVKRRMDALLEKINTTGMESLETDERRFLRHASSRLKASKSEEAPR